MTELTVQKISLSGTAPTFVAAASAGNFFRNSGFSFLHVKNGGGSAITVTIDSAILCSHGFDHDVQVSVPGGGERLIGVFPKIRFDKEINGVSGRVGITYSSVTSVTVAVFEI